MIAARRPRPLALKEYLQIERGADSKCELVRGEMYAMVGGTLKHSRVAANLIRALGNRLAARGNACAVYDSNLRLWLAEAEVATYPDATVICGEPQCYDDGPRDTILNPSAVFEVLSPSTAAYDRGEKLVAYQSRPSILCCVLVSIEPPAIEAFVRVAPGTWAPSLATDMSAAIALPPLGIELALAEVFAGLD